MKRKVRIGLVLVAAIVIIMLAAGNAFAHSEYEVDCSTCHDVSSGMSITTVSTINTGPGETFQVDVVATGLAQDVFVLRIPTDVADNDQFTINVPANTENPGLVEDNDALDLDSNNNGIHAIYNITAPAFSGTYTLIIWAAQHTDNGISRSITVNVIEGGPGPSIGAPSTTPQVPLANEEFTVTVTISSSDTITYVRLQYSIDGGINWLNVTMSESGGLYSGTIPGLPNNQEVHWRIVAADSSGERVSATLTFTVGVIPIEPIEIPQFHYGWLLGAPALVIAYIGTALEYYDEERFTRIHGMMLGIAYVLTSINVVSLVMEPAGVWAAMNPVYLFDLSNMLIFMHAWHIWLGIISMVLGTLALITHLGGWKTCNLGLPAVVLWTILGIMGFYLGEVFVP
ncbi:MAG: hypothetical protein OEV85_01865 [Candidatus Thorarchaeota archaeon]|nr:hypothetical protein [Candidatus Thorarchaeota archaeon]